MRKQILDSSLYLINKNGLEDFSMRKLAKQLNIQSSTIYYYYKNKSELLYELYINTASLFFEDCSLFNQDMEEDIYNKAKLIQEHKEEFIFLLKYQKAMFLDEEFKKKFKERFKNNFVKDKQKNKFNKITHILMMGPLVMLAISDDEEKLSDSELRLLAHRIYKCYKEE